MKKYGTGKVLPDPQGVDPKPEPPQDEQGEERDEEATADR